jgi:hypothetical protein
VKEHANICFGCVLWWPQCKCHCEYCNEGMFILMEQSPIHCDYPDVTHTCTLVCSSNYEYVFLYTCIYLVFLSFIISGSQWESKCVESVQYNKWNFGIGKRACKRVMWIQFRIHHKFPFHVGKHLGHSTATKPEEKNEWKHTSTHFCTEIWQTSVHVVSNPV